MDIWRTVSALAINQLTIVMIINKCFNCGKDTSNPKYCSRSCAVIVNNKIPKRKLSKKCSKCESIVRNYKSNLCELHFQEYLSNQKESLRNLTFADYTNRECLKKLHSSSKFAHIRGLCRSWNKDKLKLPCYVCGYTKHVELAHIKPLRSFKPSDKIGDANSSSNIVQLCRNCHWEYDHKLITLDFPDQPESQ
jgi:hypothetical protein